MYRTVEVDRQGAPRTKDGIHQRLHAPLADAVICEGRDFRVENKLRILL